MSDDLISRSALRNVILNDRKLDGVNANWEVNRILVHIDNAPTVEERPQGERAERALAIIDRLRTDGHINNKEQGTLRRAILLPERPQGEWIEHYDSSDGFTWLTCSRCMFKAYEEDYNFCPNCGAKMQKGEG